MKTLEHRQRPTLLAVMGDPCGIGPEVLLKALVRRPPQARVVAIGSMRALEMAAEVSGLHIALRKVAGVAHAVGGAGLLEVIEPDALPAAVVMPARMSAECGRAVVGWRNLAAELVSRGEADAIVQGPIHVESIAAATGVAQVPPLPGVVQSHLLLVAGRLRVVHLSDHMPLRDALDRVKRDAVFTLMRQTHEALRRWGVARPSIAVAGLNPHCKGPEDSAELAPAVLAARQQGMNAVGPLPPDSVFARCAAGEFDCALALYHDQGHIAVKTLRSEDSCAIVLGEPSLRVSVAHGTAFDIAGKGVADADGMASALHHAASLAAGRGFPAGVALP